MTPQQFRPVGALAGNPGAGGGAVAPGPARTVRGRVARATQAWPALYGYTLALYVAVVLGRIHEAIPFVARLYLGKTSALVLVAAAVMQVPGRDFARLFKTTTARCLMVITGIGILSVPTSYWPSQSLGFFQNQWPQTLLLFGCVAVGVQYRRVAMACIIALTATTGLAALSFVLGGGADVNGRVFIGNALSQTYDPNQSAALFVTTLPYVVLLASRKGKLRWLAIPLIPLFVSALLKTDSRGGVVALGMVAVAFLGVATKKQRKAFLILFPLVAITLMLLPHSNLLARFSELTAGTDYNFDARDGRWPIWKRGIGMMLSHPILGVGIGAYEAANATTANSWKAAHNAYIQIGVELGIGGILAFLLAIRSALLSGWKVRSMSAPVGDESDEKLAFDRMLATAALCSLIGELTAAIFLSMAYDAMTLFALAVPTGLAMSLPVSNLKGRLASTGGGHARQPAQRRPGWRSARRPAVQPAMQPAVVARSGRERRPPPR